jgi:hypothetical protein
VLEFDLAPFQDVTPFEDVVPGTGKPVPAPLDKVPYWFGRPVTFSRCLDAAEHPAIWKDLCNDMPNSVLKQACWALGPESVEKKRGFCRDLWTV